MLVHSSFGIVTLKRIERQNNKQLKLTLLPIDKIEPTHEVDAYKRLAKQVGKISLEDLFFEVQKAGLSYLIATNRPLSNETIVAWNFYSARKRNYKGE